jgi:hypothetical protein
VSSIRRQMWSNSPRRLRLPGPTRRFSSASRAGSKAAELAAGASLRLCR